MGQGGGARRRRNLEGPDGQRQSLDGVEPHLSQVNNITAAVTTAVANGDLSA